MTAEEFYIEQQKKGDTSNITCTDDPDYGLAFYQEIFILMEKYAQHKTSYDTKRKSKRIST